MPTPSAAPALPRVLHEGDHGPDVLATKRALIRWNKGATDGVILTRTLGAAAVNLLEKFQKTQKLQIDGILGPATYAKLVTLDMFDARGDELLQEEAAQLGPRHLMVAIADLTVTNTSLFSYTEQLGDEPGDRDWFRLAPIAADGTDWAQIVKKDGKLTCDCSAHYIGCGEHAGIPSTVASGVMDSDGATGALLADLAHITLAQAKPGDGVIFTGPANPAGVHITLLRAKLANGDWRVVNHGGPDGAGPSYSTLSEQASWHAENMNAPTQVVVRLPA